MHGVVKARNAHGMQMSGWGFCSGHQIGSIKEYGETGAVVRASLQCPRRRDAS